MWAFYRRLRGSLPVVGDVKVKDYAVATYDINEDQPVLKGPVFTELEQKVKKADEDICKG